MRRKPPSRRSRMQKLADEKNGAVEQAYRFHAKACKAALPDVKSFRGCIDDAITQLV